MKSVLLSSLLVGGAQAKELVSSDRFLFKVLDRTISLQDIQYQHRNLKAMNCIYPDSYILLYFGKALIKEIGGFISAFPADDEAARQYMHEKNSALKTLRIFFKLMKYTEDQKEQVSAQVIKLIRQSALENRCDLEVLHLETLKTNFIALLRTEIYFRARYGAQLKSGSNGLETVRPSIDLFMESLDKQFGHEYYW